MKQKLIQHLLTHGRDRSWKELASMYNIDCPEKARKYWMRYRKAHMVSTTMDDIPSEEDFRYSYVGSPTYVGGWPPVYEYPRMPSVCVTQNTSLEAQKREIITQLKQDLKQPQDLAKKYLEFKELIDSHKEDRDTLLELAIFDLHIGKLSIEEETGESYNVQEAVNRYTDAIASLLSEANLDTVERILLPIGNDLFHIDSKRGATTAGTQVDYSSRFTKIVSITKELLIGIIDKLSTLAVVDIVIVPGNHDEHTTFMLGEILESYYHASVLVNVYNEPTSRKYYQYGNTSIQFTHGNQEKHQDLGLIFATEQPQMWATSKYRFCQLGHYHKSKRTSYITTDEHQGFQVHILPSLSATDAWHNIKGYKSLKQAKAFLFSHDKGLVAEYTYNL